MDFQVRKGLETPLKVHGMRTKFFWRSGGFWSTKLSIHHKS